MEWFYYPTIPLLAIFTHIVLNYKYWIVQDSVSPVRGYKGFLMTAFAFFVTDVLWGVLGSTGNSMLLYIDTMAYYLAMGQTVVLGCIYISSLLGAGENESRILLSVGVGFCVAETLLLVVNLFKPIVFSVDQDGTYRTYGLRFYIYFVQVLMLAYLTVRSRIMAHRSHDADKNRYIAVFWFGCVMALAIVIQVVYPFLPLYSMGLMVVLLISHVYVQEAEMKSRMKLMQATVNHYFVSYYINLKENSFIELKTLNYIHDAIGGQGEASSGIDYLCNVLISPEYSREMYEFMDVSTIAERMAGRKYLSLKSKGSIQGWIRAYLIPVDWDDDDNLNRVIFAVKTSPAQVAADDSQDVDDAREQLTNQQLVEIGKLNEKLANEKEALERMEGIQSRQNEEIAQLNEAQQQTNDIISSLAYSYDYLSYISLDDGSFTELENKFTADEDFLKGIECKDAREYFKYVCKYRVANDFVPLMTQFTDFSTLNSRLRNSQAVVLQYKNHKGVWFMLSFVAADRKADGTLQHVICSARMIDEEMQAQLRQQRIVDENIASNKAKTKFLQNMSHEIRTPLNAMFGFSQLLGLPDGSCTQEEKEEYNRYILNSYNMLNMLIGDIIDISDDEHGNYNVELSQVDVNAICNSSIMSVEYRVPAGVNMYYTHDIADGYSIYSDGRRIQQVIINFLTNACKNTRKGEINLHCSVNKETQVISFAVTDTGIGVPPEKADEIFVRFSKLDRYTQGSGLGLNICMMVADKLNGRVFLDKSYTQGARFVFELPLNSDAAQQ